MEYQRKRDPLDPCPVEAVLEMISGKWKVRLLLLLSYGPHSFAQLRRGLPGIKQQVLSAQLAALVQHRIVDRNRRVTATGPSSIYSLTKLGQTLMPVLEEIAAWGDAHLRSQGVHWDRPTVEKTKTPQRNKKNLHPTGLMSAEV
jgi:DNA-binding HxlR family transcriptional regulator